MFKIIQGTLPPNIDPDELREIQKEAARSWEIEKEVRRRMGILGDDDNAGFIRGTHEFSENRL
ncbi:hypothetical protein AWB80_01782 [Caballeronia pedi]|uniref:Uncharacterized protein n=1 Tax=Caballeronia pedi TaxID=1777141 RepID=A0A158A3P1_9BURK|nr:hypothetical protein [Caballeronia pedi]SAK52319.1 hypothetical protein AWB80_01782 [Caballeronia pedi]